MQYYEHGSAYEFVVQHKPPVYVLLRFILDIAQGMNFLHSQHSLIHGDLKGDNVLIDVVHCEFRCVITDFGLSMLRDCNASIQTGATRW
jgi:serine/threonine protein kinase